MNRIYPLHSLSEAANHVWDVDVQLFDDVLKWKKRVLTCKRTVKNLI